jgi:hypothetical protein
MLLNLFDPTGVCADLEKQQLFCMNGVAHAPLMPVIIIESKRNACQIHQRERRTLDTLKKVTRLIWTRCAG